MDLRQRALEQRVEAFGRLAADDRGQERIRAVAPPYQQLAKAHRIDFASDGLRERVADEILDRAQHAGDELRVSARRGVGGDMLDQQAALLVDQKEVLHAINERVLEHDGGKGGAGAPRFEPPFEPAPGEARLQRLVQRLQHALDRLADRAANRRHHEGRQDVDQRPRVTADRRFGGAFDRRREHVAQSLVACGRLQDRGRQDLAHGRGQLFRVVETPRETREQCLLAAHQNRPQLRKARIRGQQARDLGGEVLIDRARQLEEQAGEPLAVDPALIGLGIEPFDAGLGRTHRRDFGCHTAMTLAWTSPSARIDPPGRLNRDRCYCSCRILSKRHPDSGISRSRRTAQRAGCDRSSRRRAR